MIISTACQRCGENFDAHSFNASYCSDRCRQQARRERAKARAREEADAAAQAAASAEAVTADSTPNQSARPMYEATRAELERAGKLHTALGIGVLYLAQQIDMLGPSPGALPGPLVAQHAAALARATGNASGPAAGALADIIGGAGGLVALRGGRS